MPDVHVTRESRDANGVVRKRTTEGLGPNPGDYEVTDTAYDANGNKTTEVKETFHRPPGDPRNRSNLEKRETTEYGPDGQPTKKTEELFNDGVNETPFSKVEYEWAINNDAVPPRRFLRRFRRFRCGNPGPPPVWVEDFSVTHNPDGSIDANP